MHSLISWNDLLTLLRLRDDKTNLNLNSDFDEISDGFESDLK